MILKVDEIESKGKEQFLNPNKPLKTFVAVDS